MRTLLIDGDAVAFRYGFSADAATSAVRWVGRWLAEHKSDRAIVAFSCPRDQCFRRAIAPTYKTRASNRPDGYDAAYGALARMYPCRSIAGLEADDVLGVLATHPAVRGERVKIGRLMRALGDELTGRAIP
jgi:hypothetical protein